MAEDLIEETAKQVRRQFEDAKLDAGVTWVQMAKEYKAYPAQINRAINGNTDPKSKEIRSWLYTRLKMEMK